MTKCRFLTTRRNARPKGSLAEHSHTSKGAPGDLRRAAKSGLTLRASSNAPYIRRIQMAHSVIKARPRTDKRSEASPHPSPPCASLYSFLSLYLHVTPLSPLPPLPLSPPLSSFTPFLSPRAILNALFALPFLRSTTNSLRIKGKVALKQGLLCARIHGAHNSHLAV